MEVTQIITIMTGVTVKLSAFQTVLKRMQGALRQPNLLINIKQFQPRP